jgi:hypothetical protein
MLNDSLIIGKIKVTITADVQLAKTAIEVPASGSNSGIQI